MSTHYHARSLKKRRILYFRRKFGIFAYTTQTIRKNGFEMFDFLRLMLPSSLDADVVRIFYFES